MQHELISTDGCQSWDGIITDAALPNQPEPISMNWGLVYLIVALLYVFFPRDMVPDYLVGWGWLDDLIVLFFFWRLYRRLVRQRRPGSRNGQTRQRDDGRHDRSTGSGAREKQDPYAILGVAPGASREEIRSAYRRLAAQYHPDKVQHLGKELQELAEVRFKEIQQAYDQLIKADSLA